MSEQDADRPIETNPMEATPATPSAGRQLAAQREAHGWSIEQVASQLNMAPRQIQALENDDFGALPGMAIARGFLRSYAKLLQIDAAPLLEGLPGGPAPAAQPLAARATLDQPFSEARVPSMIDKSGVPLKKIIGILLVVAIAAVVMVMQQNGGVDGLTERIGQELNGVAEPPAAPAPSPSSDSPQEAPMQEPADTDSAPSIGGSADTTSQAALPEVTTSVPATAAPAAQKVEIAKNETAPAAQDALVLKVREDSWVEAKRADGSVVLSRVLTVGETETLDVKGGLSLTFGNAPGIEASLRGKPLEIKTNRNSKVASLTVK